MVGVVVKVIGDEAVVRFDEDEDEDEAEENGISGLDLGTLSEKLNSLEEKPVSGLANGAVGIASTS